MPDTCKIAKAVVFQDAGAILLARLITEDGDYVTQAAIDSIEYSVFDMSDIEYGAIIEGTLDVSTTIYDTLQENANLWPYPTGYNWKTTLPATAVPEADRVYQAEFRVTPTGGEQYYIVFQLQTKRIYSA